MERSVTSHFQNRANYYSTLGREYLLIFDFAPHFRGQKRRKSDGSSLLTVDCQQLFTRWTLLLSNSESDFEVIPSIASTMQSRLPFNSPEMAQPTNNRRGVLTRSAAKALRENNNHVSVSYDSNIVIKSSKKSQGMTDNMMMTNSSPADVLTPPRKKVLFANR